MMVTDDGEPALVALWSAPRCRSTAFLRMMTERGDRTVVHEPFSQLADFGSLDVLGVRVEQEDQLIDLLLETARREPLFFKDTTDFRYPRLLAREDFLRATRHTMIVRDPAAAVASHLRLNPMASAEEIGFERLAEIYDRVRSLDESVVVIDSDELVAAPEQMVGAYCAALDIPYLPAALSWSAGRRPEWTATSRWHEATSASTGFAAGAATPVAAATPPAETGSSAAERVASLVEANMGAFRHLHGVRLRQQSVAS